MPACLTGWLLQEAELPGVALLLLLGSQACPRLGAALASAGLLGQVAEQASLCPVREEEVHEQVSCGRQMLQALASTCRCRAAAKQQPVQ